MTAAAIQGPARRLIDDRCGIAAIEFAIAAPIVILLMMTVVEVGLLLTGSVFLEAGARNAGRYGITGASEPGKTRSEVIRELVAEQVCPSSLAESDSDLCLWSDSAGEDPLKITTRAYTDPRNVGEPEPFTDLAPENGQYDAGEVYLDTNGNGQWDADMATPTAGGAGDVVVYTVTMAQAIHTPLLRAAVGSSVYYHRTQLVVRNEPF